LGYQPHSMELRPIGGGLLVRPTQRNNAVCGQPSGRWAGLVVCHQNYGENKMSTFLEKAFDEFLKFSETEQNIFAKWILEVK